MRTHRPALLIASLLAAHAVAQTQPTTDFVQRPAVECSPRAGLPRVLAKIRASGTVRIAYLGGSITAHAGWRVLSREWLAAQYPNATFEEILAAIPGTGAEFGAARLRHDVLDKKPDLIFVEFAVNGAGDVPPRATESMEGIVRQARAANADVDLCFVYTIQQSMLPDLQAGRVTRLEERMERVADRYALPSIQFGVDVAARVKAGTLVFKDEAGKDAATTRASDGKTIFTADGVHPLLTTGHLLYRDAIARSWPRIVAASDVAAPRTLPAPIEPANWSKVTFRSPEELTRVGTWTQVDADDRATTTSRDLGDTRPLWRSDKVGDALEFTFDGVGFGLHSVKGPDVGQARITVDDRPPLVAAFFDVTCVPGRYRTKPWFYPEPLPPGPHRVRVETIAQPGKADRIGTAKPEVKADPIYEQQRLYLRGVYVIETP